MYKTEDVKSGFSFCTDYFCQPVCTIMSNLVFLTRSLNLVRVLQHYSWTCKIEQFTLFFTTCLSALKQKVILTDCQGKVDVAFYARWKTLGGRHCMKVWVFFSFFLNPFFSSHLKLHLRPRVSLTMKWPALKCAPLLCCHLTVWLSTARILGKLH